MDIFMALLFLYWGMMILGYIIGAKCRNIKEKLSRVGTLLFIAIFSLVFIMGVRMGSNEEVVSNLGSIGVDAFFMTVVILAGSVIAVIVTRKLLRIDRYGEILQAQPDLEALDKPHDPGDEKTDQEDNSKMITIAILGAVVSGLLCGHFFVEKIFPDYGYFETLTGNAMVVGICLLLFFVGVDFGLSGTIINSLRKAGFRVLVFPIVIVIGSLVAAFLCGLVMPISQKEALAIGAGFGWYTMAPIVITEQGYAIAGAISFMHNIMRELAGIVLIPFVAKKIGYIEATSLPGVAAMDMCIPLIERICGEKIVIYSFLVGMLQSALVPVFVPLIISL